MAPNEVPDEADVLVPPALCRVEGVRDRLLQQIFVVPPPGHPPEAPYPVAGILLKSDMVRLTEGLQGRPDLGRGRRPLLRYPPWPRAQP